MRKILIICAAVCIVNSLFAALKVDPVFSSNMVLQQDYPIAFFGTADKNTSVKVEFNGKTVSAKTDKNGNWSSNFYPAWDSNPYHRFRRPVLYPVELTGQKGLPYSSKIIIVFQLFVGDKAQITKN